VADSRGFDSTIAQNGEEAVQILEGEEHFDVIFLDLLMPHRSGWDVIKFIKENPQRKDRILKEMFMLIKKKQQEVTKKKRLLHEYNFSLVVTQIQI